MIETTVKCDYRGCYSGKTSKEEATENNWYEIEFASNGGESLTITVRPFDSQSTRDDMKHSCPTHVDDVVQDLAADWSSERETKEKKA